MTSNTDTVSHKLAVRSSPASVAPVALHATNANATDQRAPSSVVPVSEYLAFTLGGEEYGIDIQKVQELRGYDAVTHIANAPPYIKGVVNLRGSIVPITDMRIKLGLGEPRYDQFTVVIILNIGGNVMGMVVDSVSDVITLTCGQIKPAPDMGIAQDTSYLIGLGAIEERMLLLVDIDKLMCSHGIDRTEKTAA